VLVAADLGQLAISVIIPVYNRLSALKETLLSLAGQSLAANAYEVIVVDDGSAEDVEGAIGSLRLPYDLGLFQQDNKGAAAARNLGAKHARGEVLLFLDADIIAHAELLAEHLRTHDAHHRALVAGLRKPWPEARTSLVSRVLDLDSNVKNLSPEADKSGVIRINFDQAFTANLSIRKTHFNELAGLDESFPGSGWEDVEFAYRAFQSGFELLCNTKAIGYHNHPVTLPQLCRQARHYQSSAALVFQKHPELRGTVAYLRDKEPIRWGQDPWPLVARKLTRQFLALPPVLSLMQSLTALLERWWPSPRLLEFLYWKILGCYQLMGLRAGLRQYGQKPVLARSETGQND